MIEFSPKNIFNVAKREGISEIAIDPKHNLIRVDNRLDLYRLLHIVGLATFQEDGNRRVVTDSDGVPLLSTINEDVKFKNTFEMESPFYTHPVVVKLEGWTIMGTIGKATPDSSL